MGILNGPLAGVISDPDDSFRVVKRAFEQEHGLIRPTICERAERFPPRRAEMVTYGKSARGPSVGRIRTKRTPPIAVWR